MHAWAVASEFAYRMDHVTSLDDIRALLANACAHMGLSYFALTHHVELTTTSSRVARIHNYPEAWARWFDANRLGISDPIHRASHRTIGGFLWREVPDMIGMTRLDHKIFALAREAGLGDGVTVPANIPGETRGSCSFAVAPGRSLPDGAVCFAELIGIRAFKGMRRVAGSASTDIAHLTDRQRECVYWAIQGKTDREIACILSISRETVIDHLRHARQALCVHNRSQLAGAVLRHGLLCLDDLPPGHR